jgi:hypothetical protein
MTASPIPTGSSSMGPDAQRVAATLVRFEDVIEQAAACGVGPQVRRFVYITAAAGLEIEKVELSDSLTARRRDTGRILLYMWWYSRSRCNFLVEPDLADLCGAEAFGALPKVKVLRKMDVTETDLFLDGLEVLFGVCTPGDSPDHVELTEIVEASKSVTPPSDSRGPEVARGFPLRFGLHPTRGR